jgi:hypothetical protein
MNVGGRSTGLYHTSRRHDFRAIDEQDKKMDQAGASST